MAARESVPSIHRSHSSAGGGLGRAQQQQPDTRLEFGCPTLCSAATGSGGAGVQSTAGHGAGVHGRVAGWQYGGGADTRCCMWRLPGGQVWAGGGVARVQLVSRCWVWPGCVSNMKDMTCASSSRARPDPDKWPPAQPSPGSNITGCWRLRSLYPRPAAAGRLPVLVVAQSLPDSGQKCHQPPAAAQPQPSLQ